MLIAAEPARRRLSPPHWVLPAVIALALWAGLSACWIPAKALLAQRLLQTAGQHYLNGGGTIAEGVRAWPWADSWPVARLQFPARGASLWVMNNASGEALAFGPGQLQQSLQYPVHGARLIAGHNDTHFAFLPQLEVGEQVVLESRSQERGRELDVFRVTGTEVVDSRQQSMERSVQGTDLLLVTCYPFDTATTDSPLRYVVRAVLQQAAPRAVQHPDSVGWIRQG